MNEALANVKLKGLRVHYLMELDNCWRAILGAGTVMKWADGDTAAGALRAAVEMHSPVVDFLA